VTAEPAQPEAAAALPAEAPLLRADAGAVEDPHPSALDPDATGAGPEPVIDPWAHRRGEPRIFAFLWTLYLLAAVVGSVMWLAGTASLQPDAYGPAARIMLVAIAAGVTILWPMARLCQDAPEHPLRACLADVVVIVAPVQMVVWPLAFLAAWPLDVIAATAAHLSVWGLVSGGMLANALLDHAPGSASKLEVSRRPQSGLTRAGWMIGIVAVVFAGQLLAALGIATARPWLADLSGLSPFAGVYEVSGHGLVGAERPVTLWQWRLIAGVGAGSLLVWLLALLRAAHPFIRRAP
jgi:hypothetical protein